MADLSESLASLFGGMFGGGDPYKKAMKQYEKYGNKAAGYQNPFFNAGTGAMGDYQNYLKNMENPSDFINQLMGGYNESPQAKYLQDQSIRAAQNAGSASGMTGSTALTQFMQENAGNIASQDMDKWLQNVLGVNKQYGGGLENLMGYGQNASNKLSDIFGNMGEKMGGAAGGSQNYKNKQLSDIFGGLFGIGGNMPWDQMFNGSGGGGNSGGNAGGMGGMEKYFPLLLSFL